MIALSRRTLLAATLAAVFTVAAHGARAESILVLPGELRVPVAEAPADIAAVMHAFLVRLQGDTSRRATAQVRFEQSAARAIDSHEPSYVAFRPTEIRIQTIMPLALERRDTFGREITGLVTLEDAAARRARLAFALSYRGDEDEARVEAAEIIIAPPARLHHRVYLVPAAALSDRWTETRTSHAKLLREVAAASVDPAAADLTRDWRVVFFVLDRLASDDALELHPAVGAEARYMEADYAGWKVVETRLPPDRARRSLPSLELWLNPGTAHAPDARNPRLIAAIGR